MNAAAQAAVPPGLVREPKEYKPLPGIRMHVCILLARGPTRVEQPLVRRRSFRPALAKFLDSGLPDYFELFGPGRIHGHHHSERRRASFYALNFNATGRAAANETWRWALFLQDDWRIRTNVTLSYGCATKRKTISAIMPISRRESGWLGELTPTEKTNHPKPFSAWDTASSTIASRRTWSCSSNFRWRHPAAVSCPETAFFDPNQAVLPTDPNFQASPATPQTVYQPNPNLRTPYTMQTGVTLERQLTKSANLSVTYLSSRGNHQFFTNFTNANQIPPGALAAQPPSQILYQFNPKGSSSKTN